MTELRDFADGAALAEAFADWTATLLATPSPRAAWRC